MNPNTRSGKLIVVTVAATTPKKKEDLSSTTLAFPAVKSSMKQPSEGTSKDNKAKRVKKVTSGEDEKIDEDTKRLLLKTLMDFTVS
ncbi:unnamed protein product [Arabis nemorensis]|uniref:Uncharacterized protein n=1 Tax=Arabis nemorensis TaxID=586526 RepID=A0A565ARQ4_9BRAS|nr:unnamed protein product [Arabis nemorensis]